MYCIWRKKYPLWCPLFSNHANFLMPETQELITVINFTLHLYTFVHVLLKGSCRNILQAKQLLAPVSTQATSSFLPPTLYCRARAHILLYAMPIS